MKIERSRTRKPVSPDEVPDGQICLQFMFRHEGKFYAYNAMGGTRAFVVDANLREKILWPVVAACVAQAAAIMDIDLTEFNRDPESPESLLYLPNGRKSN